MNLTPKKTFQENKQFAERHRDLVVSTAFRDALHAALLEQVLALPQTTDTEAAAAAYHSIMGARYFIESLLNIAEMPKELPKPPPTNLNHGVK